jgi:signal transduction histidine kinase
MEDAAGTLLEGVLHHEMRVPRALPHRRIGMELRQDVYSIFKEILQNVLKHSGASQVQIDVSYRDPYLTFAVEDDGRGFDPASAKRGNGLGLMELRTKKHGARLDIGRSAHGGTRVELKVRVG